ncbi:hypothetical protein J1N35_034650 [Gossypium stocksii]|uniref:DUF8040 domain-containing protein n=1 Tax=Gossypium stocksii TaxID=47602 RepID=A0A9D3USZ5_9ROSI|nr:hypothetical protein J1N35_034650 [Gossypium stocksii]
MHVDEQVTMFLHIISHHLKNRVIKHHFNRSRKTVSKSFHNVLNDVIRLQDVLFKKAKPITANFIDSIWKWFKEGSVVDGRVLRDAISRRHGLKVPHGCYYLADAASKCKHHNFPYYDQLTSIYAKDRSIGKDAQTSKDIVEEIDVKDVATVNNLKERNNYHGCKDDVSLDEMDVSATQL